MPDPVEELLNALVLIAAGGLSAKAHEKRATEAISRFNAERGEGVWVPRADLDTIASLARRLDGGRTFDDCIWDLQQIDDEIRRMIAAINPEGNDNETKPSRLR